MTDLTGNLQDVSELAAELLDDIFNDAIPDGGVDTMWAEREVDALCRALVAAIASLRECAENESNVSRDVKPITLGISGH